MLGSYQSIVSLITNGNLIFLRERRPSREGYLFDIGVSVFELRCLVNSVYNLRGKLNAIGMCAQIVLLTIRNRFSMHTDLVGNLIRLRLVVQIHTDITRVNRVSITMEQNASNAAIKLFCLHQSGQLGTVL